MKTGKKILSMVLAVLMCFSIMLMTDLDIEASALTWGDYTYTVTDGNATITDVDTAISGEVIIPETLGGYPVTAIGEEAFACCYCITSVVVPEGVASVGSYAFAGCSDVKFVFLPDSLNVIGEYAFAFCTSLEKLTIPSIVKNIQEGTFAGCAVLKEINVGENVETIEQEAFLGCASLEKIEIPESVITIGSNAFDVCLSLYDVIIGAAQVVVETNAIGYTRLEANNVEFAEWLDLYIKCIQMHSGRDMSGYEDYPEFKDKYYEITTIYDEGKIKDGTTIYGHEPSTAKTYADANGIPFKNISEYEKENHTCTFGEWYTVTEATVFAQGEKRRDCECGKYETDVIAKLENAATKDETTNVEITYTDDNFDKAVEVTVSEEAVNANIVFEDEYKNYKAYDISLLVDGKKVQPNGKVTVKLPVPADFNAESIAVYYIDGNGNKTRLDSKVENGFVVFETDHFSEYVIVDESSKIEEPIVPDEPTVPEEPSDPTDNCSCNCHKGGIKAFFFKLFNFFAKLFNPAKRVCACGVKH